MHKQVAVLFAMPNSIYHTIAGCNVWDKQRDARLYPGGSPVVAHPPCRSWGQLRYWAKPEPGEKELAIFAVDQVRQWGGVLEHPARSTLWPIAGLPEPGHVDGWGGWTLVVDQNWWGHRAQKRTRLYIVGCAPSEIPRMPIRLGKAPCVLGLYSKRNKARCRPSITKHERSATPLDFAVWLIELARRCEKHAACDAERQRQISLEILSCV